MKLFSINLITAIVFSFLFVVSCEKDSDHSHKDDDTCCADDTARIRADITKDGYQEVEVESVVKIKCYFEKWDKSVFTPVSGLFEYYDTDDNWVATIDLGNGECDEWGTKSWNTDVFPKDSSGSEKFSVFKF